MVYHSSFLETEAQVSCGTAILPIKALNSKGPAPQGDPSAVDIIDEALDYFRCNVLFKNFEIKGPADRTLIYLTLFIAQLIEHAGKGSFPKTNKVEGKNQLLTLAVGNFSIPGDPGFVLGPFFEAPGKDKAQADLWKGYFKQVRQETVHRFVDLVYDESTGTVSKWWLVFNKFKFLNKQLK